MYKIQFKIMSFLLIFITNMKVIKTDASFLSFFSFIQDIFRYNNIFGHSLSKLPGLGLIYSPNFSSNF